MGMKRPKLKKASKRMSCSKKYRIEKNVRAHKKKLKKEAKKNQGKVKQIKKDPGIPNSAPFKEQILREAELRKQRAEAEKLRQREQRRNEVNKRRSLEGLQKDALQRQQVFEAENAKMVNLKRDKALGLISNETSVKTFYKEFRKVVEASDVVLEVLDARDPLGCRCLEVERTALGSGADKKVVLVLNKIDLVPKENVEKWIKYLRNEFPTVAFKSSTQSQKNNLIQCKVPLKQINSQLLSTTSQCVGAESLLKLLSNYCRNNDVETSITVGVVGFPNVGKSSVINSLKRAKACSVGSTPGITKNMQEVTINKNIKILDSPGIVMSTGSSDAAVILRNCVKVETLVDPVTPVQAILKRCNKEQMMMRYNVTNYNDVSQFLQLLARRRGMLRKGGIPNVDAAAKRILQDWNSGKISYYTHPPLNAESHIEAKIVDTMKKEFDWDLLEQENKNSLDILKGAPSTSRSILFKSSGPTEMADQEEEEMEDSEHSEGGSEGEGEDEEDEDGEEMEEEEPTEVELGEITIDVKSKKVEEKKSKKQEKIQLEDIVKDGSNIQANKQLKELMKSNKKKKKRADKISDKLGDSLLSAMDFSSNENYDFKVDLELPA